MVQENSDRKASLAEGHCIWKLQSPPRAGCAQRSSAPLTLPPHCVQGVGTCNPTGAEEMVKVGQHLPQMQDGFINS